LDFSALKTTKLFGYRYSGVLEIYYQIRRALIIEDIIKKKVRVGSTVMTDEFTSYKGLIYKGYIHRFIEHGKEEYVNGIVHVNGMENFWSWAKEHLFKYHGMFRENLIFYLKEVEWKFNHRMLGVEEKAIKIAKLF